jgi:transposase
MNTHDGKEFAATIGMDWADRAHAVCLRAAGEAKREYQTLIHTPEALHAWVRGLQKRFGGQPVAICLELKRGPLVYALSHYEWLVLYPVNGQTVADYRRAFRSSRAKDDPTDAELQQELLERHRDKLRPWQPDSAAVRHLQQLVERRRRKLVGDQGRLVNRLIDALKGYYPQVLEWFADRNTLIFCEFLERWPTLSAAQTATAEQLQAFFAAHHARYRAVNQRRIEQLQAAVPLTEEAAVIEPLVLHGQALVAQLKAVLLSLQRFDEAIATLFDAHADAPLFRHLPGAGAQYAPRWLVAFGEDRRCYGSAQQLAQYAGIAPVTERSGNSTWIHWRWSCPKFLRQSFVEWAGESRRHSFWAQAFYEHQRALGKSHQGAVRALAFKWIRILYRCWQDRTPYDEARYLLALKAKGSPLLAQLAGQGPG